MCASSPCQNNKRRRFQSGTVLVLVLLIVALVAALSVKFAAEYQLGLARAETRWHGAQARAFLEGTEEVAKLLFSVADNDESIDFLGEDWAREVPIEDEGVSGVAKLTDASAQFNLNDLATPFVADKPPGMPDRYSEPQRRFIRLLQTFPDMPLQEDQAIGLLEAVVDWIDEDDGESGQGGAESNFYQSMPDPYLPANAPFKTLDELRLVRGFNEQPLLVLRLMPFITVLPNTNVGININTLEPVAPMGKVVNNLLRTFNASTELVPVGEMEARRFIESRPVTGFPDVASATTEWNQMFGGKTLDAAGIVVKTGYFWLNSTVQLVDQRRSMRSLMVRGDQRTLKVIQRDDVFELPTVVRDDEKDKDDGETELVE